jgi:DNA repair exonuclease SbcCD ATPase subunit
VASAEETERRRRLIAEGETARLAGVAQEMRARWRRRSRRAASARLACASSAPSNRHWRANCRNPALPSANARENWKRSAVRARWRASSSSASSRDGRPSPGARRPSARAASRQKLQDALAARQQPRGALATHRDALEGAAAELRQLEEARLKTEQGLNPLRDRIGDLRLKAQAAQLNEEQYVGRLAEANANETELAPELTREVKEPLLQGDIARLSSEIEALGPVNLAALDELNTSRERKGFLDSQSEDLIQAIDTLEDAIRRIDRETREQLQDTYNNVNRQFGILFPQLFGGGEARLILTGEEILDSGIQVMAQPPGKKNSSIHLLSGGEKALTAIALVFSLFQLNPGAVLHARRGGCAAR